MKASPKLVLIVDGIHDVIGDEWQFLDGSVEALDRTPDLAHLQAVPDHFQIAPRTIHVRLDVPPVTMGPGRRAPLKCRNLSEPLKFELRRIKAGEGNAPQFQAQ